jgi:hypothetical protein
LRFGPTAWAKLVFWRDVGPTEIGAFGISSADDPLFVEDIELVRQECSPTSVTFEDEGVADFLDAKLDQGIALSRCARIWVHTHPDSSALPSPRDEETFGRVFAKCDWAVMAILACSGKSYARLRFGVGPGGALRVKVVVDYSRPFPASDEAAWLREYEACVMRRLTHHGRARIDLPLDVPHRRRSADNPLMLDEAYDRYF